jgi:hypothetical protein
MTDETKYPSDAADRFQVRLPPGLRERIAETAKANSRSMNSEIVSTLMEAYPETLPEARRLYRRIYDLVGHKPGEEFGELHKAIDDYLTYMARATGEEIAKMFEQPFDEEEPSPSATGVINKLYGDPLRKRPRPE